MWTINWSLSNAKVLVSVLLCNNHYVIFQEKKKTEAEVQRSEDASDAKGDKDEVTTLRCLNVEDIRHCSQVCWMENCSLQWL